MTLLRRPSGPPPLPSPPLPAATLPCPLPYPARFPTLLCASRASMGYFWSCLFVSLWRMISSRTDCPLVSTADRLAAKPCGAPCACSAARTAPAPAACWRTSPPATTAVRTTWRCAWACSACLVLPARFCATLQEPFLHTVCPCSRARVYRGSEHTHVCVRVRVLAGLRRATARLGSVWL
jgi:hypothetical protein